MKIPSIGLPSLKIGWLALFSKSTPRGFQFNLAPWHIINLSWRSLMHVGRLIFLLIFSLSLASAGNSFGQTVDPTVTAQGQAPPKTWIDAKTGHRVTRVSNEPSSKALYFNVNAFTSDGKDMIYTSPSGIYVLDMATLNSSLLVRGSLNNIVVGTKTRRVFFMKVGNRHVYVANLDTGQVAQLVELPPRGMISTLNADETLLAGTYIEGNAANFHDWKFESEIDPSHPSAMEMRLASNVSKDIFTVNLQSGQVNVILQTKDWVNHVLFSPTDPSLLMYSHEGPSLTVDRIWTVRSDGSQNALIHTRTNSTESVVHEFWSKDGRTIWYDLQRTKGQDFALGGYVIATGENKLFHLRKVDASIHYNSAADDSLFCADGNFPTHGELGKHGHPLLNRNWIVALYPVANSSGNGASSADADSLRSDHLVDMASHNYATIEPNVRFSPDSRLVIFTSNMFGSSYIFAVEIAKAEAVSTGSVPATN